jgi:L-2-hydroxyglutarate oxidase
MKRYNIAIVGAGVIGSSIAYILSAFSNLKVVLIEMESSPAVHTSSRNTGVIHRPFYLNPEKKFIFARSSQYSYEMWKELAIKYSLPWKENGTIEVATTDHDWDTIENYKIYSEKNGIKQNEFKILNKDEIKELEPKVDAEMAFYSKTDTNVSFGSFTRKLVDLSINAGLDVLFNSKIISIDDLNGNLLLSNNGKEKRISSDLIINASGGGSLRIAKSINLANKYSVLHFRGDYWRLRQDNNLNISHNIYSVPQHLKYPFLDPHFIVRPDGVKEIGPNAHLVGSPYGYRKGDLNRRNRYNDLLSLPLLPKLKLFTNLEFLSMVRKEWKSSTFQGEMIKRVKKFIPEINENMISGSGLSGVRHSLIDNKGFVPEVIIETGQHSIHILNFNSPGATGSPAFSCYLIEQMIRNGLLDNVHINTKSKNNMIWAGQIEKVMDIFS